MIPLRLKFLAEAITPPIIFRYLRRSPPKAPIAASSAQRAMFEGDYSSFEEAAKLCKGYDDAAVASAAAKRLIELKTAVPPREIDGRFQQVHSALCVVSDKRQSRAISVLDVGGGNGSYYFRLKELFPAGALKWHVVETANMVAACRQIAAPEITYSSEVPTERFDVVLISGTLQYLPRPYQSLNELSRAGDWLILTRLPVHDGANDRIMIQNVPSHIHEGSMPVQMFSVVKMQRAIDAVGDIELSWSVDLDDGSLAEASARAVGFLVRTR